MGPVVSGVQPGRGTLRNGNPGGDPNTAPRCGARTRSGCACRAPAMQNGRCRMHGGKSTGPRTAAGMARMIAAKTTHGDYGAGGTMLRAHRHYARALVARSDIVVTAMQLRPYLPPEMAARLWREPPELERLKHPSQVVFELECARQACNAGAGGSVVALRARERERAAAVADEAVLAPWRAAIAFARAAKRAAKLAAKARASAGGSGGGAPRVARNEAMHRELAFRAAGLRGARPSAASPRAAGAAVGERCTWGRRWVNPLRAAALGTTTLAGRWAPRLRDQLEVQFGRAGGVAGWRAAGKVECAQRPHTPRGLARGPGGEAAQ